MESEQNSIPTIVFDGDTSSNNNSTQKQNGHTRLESSADNLNNDLVNKNNLSISVTNVINQPCDFSRITDVKGLLELFTALYNRKFTNKTDRALQEWTKYYEFPRLLLREDRLGDQLTPLVLQPSLFHGNNVPPTIYFNTKQNNESTTPISLPRSLLKHFKWKFSTITPNSIRHCITFTKLETIKSSNTTDNFIGSWCKHMLTSEFQKLDYWRKVNHFPGSFHMGRKDKLWMRLNMATSKFGKDDFGEFHPTTFVLPKDYEELKNFWNKSGTKLFIMKPPASSRGNGIKVINDISQIPTSAIQPPPREPTGVSSKKSTMIVQRYISNPCLLENGQKFDLRIYVLLTSVDPLRIYVYQEGLVRFASSKYTIQEDGIIDQYMHLTNYFINKNSQGYKINNDCDSLNGSKWTLTRFWRHLEEHYPSVDTKQLWSQIIDIIVKTVVCCEGPIVRYSRQNCKNDYTSYELFGFDIILDDNFKPWILEVNITPSLKSDSDLDSDVKYRVIKDMFNLVGYTLPPSTLQECKSSDRSFWFDKRLYTENLTKQDRSKHLKFQKYSKSDIENDINSVDQHDNCNPRITVHDIESTSPLANAREVTRDNPEVAIDELRGEFRDVNSSGHDEKPGDDILYDLTQNDMRVLMLSEDELSRCGDFMRVFPTSNTRKYLRYFDKVRYYNLLLDAWEQTYKDRRSEGALYLAKNASFLD